MEPLGQNAYRAAINSEIQRVTGKRPGAQPKRRSDEIAVSEATNTDMARGVADEVERLARKPSATALRSDQLPIAGHVPNGIRRAASTISCGKEPGARYEPDTPPTFKG